VFDAPLIITAIAVASAVCGVWLSSVPSIARRMVPFGGGILVGVALLWVLPEMAAFWNWTEALAWIVGGFTLLWIIDHFVYPVCPSCSHSDEHDHDHCHTELHGFGPPLLIATALHAALDGWSVVAANGLLTLGPAFVLAVAVHKIPEGIALGVIARAALGSRRSALLWSVAAELMTLTGAALELALAPYLGQTFLHALLALAGGAFIYLGGHAVHGEWRRRGWGAAIYPAFAGIAGLGALRLFGRIG
jgi:zinc transporter ZupT